MRGNNEQLWNCIWQFAKEQHELEIFKHLIWSHYVGKSNLKVNKLEQTRKLREKEDTHKLKMQKKGKKGTWDGSVPHSIFLSCTQSSKNFTQKPSNNTINITHIPNHYDQHSIHSPNKANKTYTTYTKQKQHWSIPTSKRTALVASLKHYTLVAKKIEDGGRGMRVSFVGELPI